MLLNPIFIFSTALPYLGIAGVVPPGPTSEPAETPTPALVSPPSLSMTSLVPQDPDLGDPGPWYLSVGAALVTTESSDGPGEEIDFNEGYGINLAVGKQVWLAPDASSAFDVELEAFWRDQDVDDDGLTQAVRDVNLVGAFLNGIKTWRLGQEQRFDFALGAGLGLAWINSDTVEDDIASFDSDDGPNLAWNVQLGLGYHPSASTRWGIGYRLLNVDDTEVDDDFGDDSFDLETMQHSVEIGVRFKL